MTSQPSASELQQAYEAVFTSAYGSIVLRDLAERCGFMASLPPGVDLATLVDHNARRAVFGHLYEILSHSVTGRDVISWAIKPADKQGTTT